MQATEFEFRHRFWLIGAIFWAAFGCYFFDRVNVTRALVGSQQAYVRIMVTGATLLVAAAAMLRTWAAAYLQSEVVHDHSLHTDRLVAEGPYRYVRNPLYLGSLLMTLGMALLASRTGALFLVIAMPIFQHRLIGREEDALLKTQGESYRAYLAAVPRLWPSFLPRVPSGGMIPRWKQAFLGETFFWGFALATGVFGLTLNLFYFGATVTLLMLFKIFVQPRLLRHS